MGFLGVQSFGIEKAVAEPSLLRRVGYRLIGEIHIPGRIRINHVRRAVAELGLPDSGVTMLDAGTGRGDLALHFARIKPGWLVRGFDIEWDRIARCCKAAEALGLRNVSFQCRDLLTLDEDSAYDLITCADVLEHIENDVDAVKALARALKPGGRLVLTFPSVPQRRHLRLVKWRESRIGFTPADIGHVRPGYSVDDVERLFKVAGLRLIKVRWTYGPFGNLAHDIFFVLGDSNPNLVLYLTALPFLLLLSFLDTHTHTEHGSGLLIVGLKPNE